ncbi:hypothetical protein Tco_0071590 [Tanacetum coccineum]
MVDSWKSMDLSKLVINGDMLNYVLGKYGNNWQVDDVIVDEILGDLLKIELEKQQCVKVSTDDALESSSEDTCSPDATWEQKKLLKVNQGLALQKLKKQLKGMDFEGHSAHIMCYTGEDDGVACDDGCCSRKQTWSMA